MGSDRKECTGKKDVMTALGSELFLRLLGRHRKGAFFREEKWGTQFEGTTGRITGVLATEGPGRGRKRERVFWKG